MKLVKITWLDHCTYSENKWRSPEEMKELKPMLVESVGWVIKETKTYYLLVATNGGHTMTGEFLILKGTIKKIKEL